MRDFEILYRKCSRAEAEKIGRAQGLVTGQVEIKQSMITHKSEPQKWVTQKRRFVMEYCPSGRDAGAYSHAAEFFVLPGTLETLQIERREGLIHRGPTGAYGIPPDLLDWFNDQIVNVNIYNLGEQGLPERTPHSSLYVLELDTSSDTRYSLYMAVSPELLNGNSFSQNMNRGRMTWLKTSLAWTLWRSDWGNNAGQERIIQIDVSEAYLERLSSVAVSSRKNPLDSSRRPEAIYQRDPDRRIIGRRLQSGQDPFVNAGRTVHFGIRDSELEKFLDDVSPLRVQDVTESVQAIRYMKPPHATQVLYDALNVEPTSYPFDLAPP